MKIKYKTAEWTGGVVKPDLLAQWMIIAKKLICLIGREGIMTDITPNVTLEDVSLKDLKATSRINDLKEIYFAAYPQIGTERPGRLTE